MGIFETYSRVKKGKQRISENFLKKCGFKKCQNWGSPSHWGPGSVFWEKIIFDGTSLDESLWKSAVLYYFPDSFTGYVTPYCTNGIEPKNHVLGWVNQDDGLEDVTGCANCKMDILYYIDKLNKQLE